MDYLYRFRLIGILFLSLIITGCVSAPPLNFSVPDVHVVQNKVDADLKSLTVVIGAPAELVMDVPPDTHLVTDAWRNALQNAIDRSLIFNDDSQNKININVKILGFDMPSFGLDMTCTSVARYEILDRSSGEIIFSKEVTATETVPVGYAFVGYVRARESVNRSVQSNIMKFLEGLEEELTK